jgi:hypothetical protein
VTRRSASAPSWSWRLHYRSGGSPDRPESAMAVNLSAGDLFRLHADNSRPSMRSLHGEPVNDKLETLLAQAH